MMIFDVPKMVQDIFGYEDIGPLPLDQFIEQELRLEREAREKETARECTLTHSYAASAASSGS